MAYFAGLDCGGTKTECWIGDERRVMGRARTGTVKLSRVGAEVATERMRALLREAAVDAGVSLRDVKRTCVGIAGYSVAAVREWTLRTVGEAVGGEVEACGDDEIALDAAFRGGAGILTIGGTGAVVLGRCADGTRYTAGGWGPMIGDEGSGFWIGREAVKRAFWAYDRGEETGLLRAIQQAWKVEDMWSVVGVANDRGGADFSALTPAVVECALAGDKLAVRILKLAGDELAAQVGVVWGKMRAHGELTAGFAYTGSVVEKVDMVRERMTERIGIACPALRQTEGAVNSLEGALWRARGGTKAYAVTGARRTTSGTLVPQIAIAGRGVR